MSSLESFQKSHLKNWPKFLHRPFQTDGLEGWKQYTFSIKSNLIDKQIVLQFYRQQKVHFCMTPKKSETHPILKGKKWSNRKRPHTLSTVRKKKSVNLIELKWKRETKKEKNSSFFIMTSLWIINASAVIIKRGFDSLKGYKVPDHRDTL